MSDTFEQGIRSRAEKNKAFQVIDYQDVNFEHPHPDIHVARILIANASWVNTSEGTVVIDTLVNPALAARMRDRLYETGGPVKYVIYTHHHGDHVGGSLAFKEDHPQVLAHRYLPEGIEKYRLLKTHRSRNTSIQFNLPFRPDQEGKRLDYLEPTTVYDRTITFSLGDKTFELYHARAETDDATWVFVPEIKAAFVGDLIVAGFPNIGNPFKPTRFCLPWARALEAVRAKEPEILIAHGGRAVYEGAEARGLLDVTIEAIHSVHDQVVDGLNKEIPVDEMIHTVRLPDHLKDHPHLSFVYSRIEFAVYNIYRWYHGYFDNNPAHLLPRPDREVNREIFDLIGDADSILKRSTELFEKGQPQLALQVLDVLLKQNPDHVEGRRLRLRILEVLCEEDYCLMSRNTWVYFMDQDREFLKTTS